MRKRKPARVFGEHLSSERALSLNDHRVYASYLRSPEWRIIRTAVLGERPDCELCGDEATQVHHHSYHTLVMAGALNDALVSVCESCHKDIEFEQGMKLDHEQARINLKRLLFDRKKHDVVKRLNRTDAKTNYYRRNQAHSAPTKHYRRTIELERIAMEEREKQSKQALLNAAWLAENKIRREKQLAKKSK